MLLGSQSVAGAFVSTFGVEPDFWFAEGNIDPSCGNLCWGAPIRPAENPPTWDHTGPENYSTCFAFGPYPGPFKSDFQGSYSGGIYNGPHAVAMFTITPTYGLKCPTPTNNAGDMGSLLAGCPPPPSTTTTSSTTSTSTSTGTPPTTLPAAGTPIDGKKLSLKDDPADATKRKATVVSKDAAISLGAGNGSSDDPRASGATVRIVSTAGDGFDDTYPLPQSGWQLVGREGENKGYKYKDRLLTNGPVKSAIVKPGKLLKIAAKGSGIQHTLGADPNPVDVVVTMGGLAWCQRYGGTPSYRAPKSYTAKLAPASVCP
jgi:hypothetical protein